MLLGSLGILELTLLSEYRGAMQRAINEDFGYLDEGRGILRILQIMLIHMLYTIPDFLKYYVSRYIIEYLLELKHFLHFLLSLWKLF